MRLSERKTPRRATTGGETQRTEEGGMRRGKLNSTWRFYALSRCIASGRLLDHHPRMDEGRSQHCGSGPRLCGVFGAAQDHGCGVRCLRRDVQQLGHYRVHEEEGLAGAEALDSRGLPPLSGAEIQSELSHRVRARVLGFPVADALYRPERNAAIGGNGFPLGVLSHRQLFADV